MDALLQIPLRIVHRDHDHDIVLGVDGIILMKARGAFGIKIQKELPGSFGGEGRGFLQKLPELEAAV